MSSQYENSREALEQLLQVWKASENKRNEATTRFQLIDTLLLDCLGWERTDITTEDPYNGEYTDYILKLFRPVLILEAKREGNYFELPEGRRGIEFSLKSLCKDNPEFKKAIEQVCDYCQQRGIELAIVSNGWQFVAFIANRADGVPPMEGTAIVFPSLEFMLKDFLNFWNLFSKQAFEKKNLRNRLLGSVLPELPAKLSTKIKPYPGIKNRNSFQTNMQVMSDLILEDVLRYEDLEEIFLEECYCSPGALSHYSSASKDILRTRYEYLFEKNENPLVIESVTNKKGVNQAFKEVAAQSLSRRPIILIGDVGVGKTSFIKNLVKVDAKEVFENCITFRIDLGSKIIIALNIQEAIVNEIIDQLLKSYEIDIYENNFVKGVYNLDFERFKKGIYVPYFEAGSDKAVEKTVEFFEEKIKDKYNHLRQSLLHIAKARRQQVVIFIDNCDQRDYNTQQTAFLIAQEFAEHWVPITVFVSLRPETFHSSLKKGTLSGYHPKAFTISPPRIDLVIYKRLVFAKKIAEGKIPVAKLGSIVGLGSLVELLDMVIYSFEKNEDLYRFIENISNGNVRSALDMVRNFLGSGHVNTEKMLNILDDGKYIISSHEFVKAVIYGDNVYFDPETSNICNLYDVHHSDKKEHFLSLIILAIVDAKKNSGQDNGYIDTTTVSIHLQNLGFNLDQIDNNMNVLIRKNLVETSAKGTIYSDQNLPYAIRITSTGTYHLNSLINTFEYTNAMVVDTPIFDEQTRNIIQDVHALDDRLKRAKHFINYLQEIWKTTLAGKEGVFFDWPQTFKNLNRVISKIGTRTNFDYLTGFS